LNASSCTPGWQQLRKHILQLKTRNLLRLVKLPLDRLFPTFEWREFLPKYTWPSLGSNSVASLANNAQWPSVFFWLMHGHLSSWAHYLGLMGSNFGLLGSDFGYLGTLGSRAHGLSGTWALGLSGTLWHSGSLDLMGSWLSGSWALGLLGTRALGFSGTWALEHSGTRLLGSGVHGLSGCWVLWHSLALLVSWRLGLGFPRSALCATLD
jgi:hypothetical protein